MPADDPGDLAGELACARELALAAGAVVMRWFQGSYEVTDKGGQPVTIADRQANELIVTALAERFPDDAILAEETPVTTDRWRTARRCWVIDPLDGTSDFVKGREGFAVMIGLLVDGRPRLGVVHVPRAGRTFVGVVPSGVVPSGAVPSGAVPSEVVPSGVAGTGGARVAYEERDGTRRPLAVSHRARAAELRVIASIAHRDPNLEAALAALAPAQTLSVGSVGYKVGKIAADEADLYVATTGAISLWDTAAPEAILHAAGGRFLDLDGQPLQYRGPQLNHPRGLLATNGACAGDVVARLAGLFPALA